MNIEVHIDWRGTAEFVGHLRSTGRGSAATLDEFGGENPTPRFR